MLLFWGIFRIIALGGQKLYVQIANAHQKITKNDWVILFSERKRLSVI